MGKAMDTIWDNIHASQAWGGYPSEHVIRFIARNYYQTERSKVKILDFGCGGGAHTWFLAREGFDTYAFDGAEQAVINTRKKLEKEHLSAHLEVKDGTDLDYQENYFDAVIDNVSIYSNKMKDIISMYKNIYRSLKTDGKLLTVCFGKETCGYRIGVEIEKDTYTNIPKGPLHNRGTVHFFDKKEIIDILEQIGYRHITIDTINYSDSGEIIQQYVVSTEK